MLAFRDITFQYDTDPAPLMKDLSFEVGDREFVSIIGASGSGKSTVFRLINHFLIPEKGQIIVDGKDIEKERAELGYMPQHDLLFPWLRVEDNVTLPMKVAGKPKTERHKLAEKLLTRVGLEGTGRRFPRELSGGMRQRVAFARTLSTGSDLLLLDEPFSALDSITRISLQEWLRDQWLKLDKTILFVTHDVEEAIFLSQRILVLTGRPVTEAKSIEVPLPRERNRDMLLQPEILKLKNTLIEQLRREAMV
ncbi:MAG: ABC transporter ATP-binding protein [Lachnospiraceae bacterium]|nr:ABC transporter ATP-binding protein [Lachnospiraceae bacterium]